MSGSAGAVTFNSLPGITPEQQTQFQAALGIQPLGPAHFQRSYRLWETEAPTRYDYSGTLTVYGGDDTDTRFVLIPDNGELDPPQVTRYRTGLHATCRANFFDARDLAAILLERGLNQLYRGRD